MEQFDHQTVAPLAGAWVEIGRFKIEESTDGVAPLAGAWVEMVKRLLKSARKKGRSPRGSVG